MLAVSDTIKNAYNKYKTQRKSYIKVGDNSFFIQNLDLSADSYYEGNVIGNAIAKIAKFDMETVNVSGIDEFELFDGIWTGNQYEYISLGTFKLFDEKGTDDFFSSIVAYDKLIYFNKEYNPTLTSYPTTIYGLLQNLCEQAGLLLENQIITNGEQPLEVNLFVEGETLKNILNAICQISGTFAIISNDKLKLLLKGNNTINLSKYQLSKPEYKRTTWSINQVVLGMKDVDGEYVKYPDDTEIQGSIHKLVINDNPFVYTQELRQLYIENLYNQVNGFGYVAFETQWEGLPFVELGDLANVDGKESIVLRYNLKSPCGLKSSLSAPSIIDSVVEYADNSNSLKNALRKTEFTVKKHEGEIISLVSKTETIDTTIENTYNEINQKFDGYTPINKTVEIENSVVQLQTDTYTKTEINTKLKDGSVEKVKTTLVTVDDNGTTWDKNDSKVKSNADADGFKVIDKTGAGEKVILDAGYDAETGETRVIVDRVRVNSIKIGSYAQLEDYVDENGREGLGIFI